MAHHDIQLLNDTRMWNRQKIFLLSGMGVVVGFSNFWTFPALMTQYGGISFLISYLFALLVLAIPMMVLQVGLGKNLRKSPLEALKSLRQHRESRLWTWAGALLLLAATLTVVIYAVVAGMGLSYVFKSAFGAFNGADAVQVGEIFQRLQQDPEQMLLWLTLFMVVVYVISLRGTYRGLATAVQYFFFLIAILIFALAVFSSQLPTSSQALAMLFTHEVSSLSWEGIVAAFKHAFFSLALGTGVFIVLGAYMPAHGHITRTVGLVALVDATVGVLAGLIILPWLMMAELPPAQGFELIFQSVPQALSGLPLGQFFGAMLFLLLTLAAWSSAIFLIEPLVAWFEDRWKWSRFWSVTLVHLLVWGAGALLIASLTDQVTWALGGMPLFSLVQFLVSTLLLPLAGGLLMVLCVYVLPAEPLAKVLAMTTSKPIFRIGTFVLRYVCVPVLVIIQLMLIRDLWVYSCGLDEQNPQPFCQPLAESVPEQNPDNTSATPDELAKTAIRTEGEGSAGNATEAAPVSDGDEPKGNDAERTETNNEASGNKTSEKVPAEPESQGRVPESSRSDRGSEAREDLPDRFEQPAPLTIEARTDFPSVIRQLMEQEGSLATDQS